MDALHRWLRKCRYGHLCYSAVPVLWLCGAAPPPTPPLRSPPTVVRPTLGKPAELVPSCLGQHACPLQAGRAQRGPGDFALVRRTLGRHGRLRSVLGTGDWPEGRRVPLKRCAEMTPAKQQRRQHRADVAVLAVFQYLPGLPPCTPAAHEIVQSHCSAFDAHTQVSSLSARPRSTRLRRRRWPAGQLAASPSLPPLLSPPSLLCMHCELVDCRDDAEVYSVDAESVTPVKPGCLGSGGGGAAVAGRRPRGKLSSSPQARIMHCVLRGRGRRRRRYPS